MSELLAALCRMVVIEGLVLFAMPEGWKRTVFVLLRLPTPALRRFGAVVMVAGLAALVIVRQLAG